jgi:hypothetical protein
MSGTSHRSPAVDRRVLLEALRKAYLFGFAISTVIHVAAQYLTGIDSHPRDVCHWLPSSSKTIPRIHPGLTLLHGTGVFDW